MRSLTVRLPDHLVLEIETESRRRNCPKSDIVRERLQRGADSTPDSSSRLSAIADLVGSVHGLPPDLSTRKKQYLKTTRYGEKRPR